MTVRKMNVPEPIWRWVYSVKVELEAERDRTVTLPESWEHIKAVYEAAQDEPVSRGGYPVGP